MTSNKPKEKKKEEPVKIEQPQQTQGIFGVVVATAILSSVFTFLVCFLVFSKPNDVRFQDKIEDKRDVIPPYQLSKQKILEMEEKIKNDFPSTPLIPEQEASIEYHWNTPILYLNVKNLGIDVLSFNAKIGATILQEYHNLVDANKDKLSKSAGDSNDINRWFFDWQKNGGWKLFEGIKEFKKLKSIMETATDMFLTEMGSPQDFVRNQTRKYDIWASVHHNCVAHLRHTHEHCVVSGVYYVKTPKETGKLLLHDPRGPLPPFDKSIIKLTPKSGDLIIFPSWLIHEVAPTEGDSERISIAWNVPGHWEATTSVSMSYPIDLSKYKVREK